jgi:hypothetical protein
VRGVWRESATLVVPVIREKNGNNSESENLFDSFHRNTLMGFYRHV